MEDNFDLYNWNNKRRLAENKLASISDMMSLNDKRVNAVAQAIEDEFGIEISSRLKGVIRTALADYIEEDLGLDVDQNINKDDEGSSFNVTHGGDDPKIGAEEESDANVVGENELINHPKLALNVLKKIGRQTFIDVYKEYEGAGQSRNRELKKELMGLVTPEVEKLKLSDNDEEKVYKYIRDGLAGLEGAMMRKNIGL
tara:strand:+ start:1191 stop:1787 length:597 start_codon:yes stop_codon:yes gene_type:complete